VSSNVPFVNAVARPSASPRDLFILDIELGFIDRGRLTPVAVGLEEMFETSAEKTAPSDQRYPPLSCATMRSKGVSAGASSGLR
jgi:hypothetical protein